MTFSSPFLDTIQTPFASSFGMPAAADTFFWYLKTSGFVEPTSTPTYTGPSTFWAPDNLGVYQNMGGLANSLGQRIPPVAGARLATTEAGGAFLGDETVTDSGFDDDSYWTKSAGTVTVSGSRLNFSGAASGVQAYRLITPQGGRVFKITFTIVSISGGGVRWTAHGVDGTVRSAPGTYTETMTSAGGNLHGLKCSGITTAVCDNLSIKEVIPIALTTDAGGAALTGMQMVLQPSVTNKVTCRKRNPTDLTNLTKGGDAASVLSVVSSVAALGATLGTICSSGNVYKLDNSAGVAIATATAGGTTTNTNKHSLMVWARKVSGAGSSLLQMSGGEASVAITGTSFARFVVENVTPGATTRQWQIVAGIGDVLEFILPSMTETMAATAYPVVDSTDAATAVTFTATDFSYPNPLPLNNWQFRTKIKVDGTPTTDMWLWSDGTAGVYYKGSDQKFYYKHGGGTEIATAAITAGNTYDLGVRQSAMSGASISLNQSVTTNAAVTADYTPAATLMIGDKTNSLYFRGRLQQFDTNNFFQFSDLSNPIWYSEDV